MKLKGLIVPVLAVAATLTIAIACSETSTGPSAPAPETPVAGTIFEAMWIAGDGGQLRFAGSTNAPVGPASVAAGIDTTAAGSSRATALQRRLASGQRATLSTIGEGHHKTVMRGHLVSYVVDGKRMDLIAIPDPDRASKRPARAYVTRINGKAVSVIEFQYVKAANGRWRNSGSRVTSFDTTGALLGVADFDRSGVAYAAATLRGPGREVLGALASLFAPDELHAEVTEAEASYAGCMDEFKSFLKANGAALAAGALYVAAQGLTKAASLAYLTALIAAVEDPELVMAAEAAYATYLAREAAEFAALLVWAGAIAAAEEAGRTLGACLTGKPKGGGESDCDAGKEQVCDWSLEVFDGKLYFSESNCACERTYQT